MLQIAASIQEAQNKKKDMSSEEVDDVLNSWKKDVKEARDSCLALSAPTTLNGSVTSPSPFAIIDIKISPADFSSRGLPQPPEAFYDQTLIVQQRRQH